MKRMDYIQLGIQGGASTRPGSGKKLRRFILSFLGLSGAAALYTWTALTWSYSIGERVGYVQKFSRKGWFCKTWEGELAMATMPGAIPEKFNFTARSEGIAGQISATMGKKVSLSYGQHLGLPTSCFGETEYYVVSVKPLD